jgi:hypothetical protein
VTLPTIYYRPVYRSRKHNRCGYSTHHNSEDEHHLHYIVHVLSLSLATRTIEDLTTLTCNATHFIADAAVALEVAINLAQHTI